VNTGFHECRWRDFPPFFIGSDPDNPDVYTEWIRALPGPEPALHYALNCVQGGKKFIDVGANVGLFTLATARAGARVLAVEALAKNYAILVQSIVKNQLENVTPLYCAIFDHTGTLSMQGTSAWGQVAASQSEQQIPCLTLDDLCSIYDFRNASVLKIDIEGSELAALSGASDLLSQNTNMRIIFEANAYASIAFGYHPRALFRRCEEYGYQVYRILDDRLALMASDAFQESVCEDYAAVRKHAEQGVPGFELPPLTLDERVEMVVLEATHAGGASRAYIYASAAEMSEEIRSDERVSAALARLEDDADPGFCRAVDVFRSAVK
jgi:FkbM family methyltransferase